MLSECGDGEHVGRTPAEVFMEESGGTPAGVSMEAEYLERTPAEVFDTSG
jgi:hypothetical protein